MPRAACGGRGRQRHNVAAAKRRDAVDLTVVLIDAD